jgi:hypothetical protein
MKTLLISVIYPGVEKYLNDYFTSINNQTYKSFDVLIIEDGFSLPGNFMNDNILVKKSMSDTTHAGIKFQAINFAKVNNYGIIIFADADDYFSKNRVEQTLEVLNNSDICINKIIPVAENGEIINQHNSFEVPHQIEKKELLRTNYFGLTNTAITTSSLPEEFYIPSDIIAVDWWLFTLLLLNDKKYIYDNNSTTYYRQHENNTIGFKQEVTREKILLGTNVKQIHYENLLKYCNEFGFKKYSPKITELIQEFKNLEIELKDGLFMEEYIAVIKNNIDRIKTGWWSEIITMNEFEHYRQFKFSKNTGAGLE